MRAELNVLNHFRQWGRCWVPVDPVRPPPPVIFHITGHSNVILLICFSVFAWFGVSYCTVITLCVSRWYFFRIRNLKWSPFGKELLIRLTMCTLCILTACNVRYFPLWFWAASLLIFYFLQKIMTTTIKLLSFFLDERQHADWSLDSQNCEAPSQSVKFAQACFSRFTSEIPKACLLKTWLLYISRLGSYLLLESAKQFTSPYIAIVVLFHVTNYWTDSLLTVKDCSNMLFNDY